MGSKKTAHRGVKALGRGRYQLRIYVDGRDYIRTVKAKSTREAARQRDELEEEIRRRTVLGPLSKISGAADRWLRRKLEAKRHDGSPRYAPTTRRKYESAVRLWIKPMLGDYDVLDLTADVVRDWRDALAGQLRSKTVNGYLVVLGMIMGEAGSDVVDHVEKLEEDDTRTTDDEPNMLVGQEIAAFLRAAKSRRQYPLLLFLVTTGARVSTALAARWEDVDAAEGVVHLRRRLSEGEVLQGAKRSRRSKDVVPLLPELLALLEGRRGDSPWLFPGKTPEKPLSRQRVTQLVEEVRQEAGVSKRLSVHGLRRTAALAFRLASRTELAMSVLGHQTEQMHRHYAPEQTAEKRNAAALAFAALMPPDSA